MPTPWPVAEVKATVADYLHMWLLEQAGQAYNKTTHRKALQRKLNNRTEAAIEFKHQNISAILMEHGWQNIPGYKPSGNYQALLAEVADRIMRDRQFDLAAEVAADQPAVVPLVASIADVMVERPRVQPSAQEQRAPYYAIGNPQLKRDSNVNASTAKRAIARSAKRVKHLWCCLSNGACMRRARKRLRIRSNTPRLRAVTALDLTWSHSNSMVRRDLLK
jgi:hypothetical protein